MGSGLYLSIWGAEGFIQGAQAKTILDSVLYRNQQRAYRLEKRIY